MATRNFVPRSGSEGQIGTSAKPWAVVVADIMHVGTMSGSISSSVDQTGSFGYVYSAGNIYAAGEVSADSFVSRDGNNTISFQDDVAFGADDSITSILNITASNNISASGNIYGTTGSFGRIFAAGDIYATGEVSADSFVSRDGNNTISFQDDVAFGADDSITSIQNITATGNISGSVTSTGSFYHIKSNRIQSTDNGGLRLFEDGGSGIFIEDGGRVGIGDLSPESTLKITGDLTVSTNITASNDIKMGGKIVIDQDQPIEFHLTQGTRDRIIRDSTSNAMNMLSRGNIGLILDSNSDDTDAVFSVRMNGYTHAASTPLLTVTQQHEISGSAASTGSFGRLETAGDINSDGRIYENNTSVIDHATAMAIVFGG